MTQFDHRFNSLVERTEDVRFQEQSVAEDYAIAQCKLLGSAQNVVLDEGMFKVIELPKRLDRSVFFVDEVVGQ